MENYIELSYELHDLLINSKEYKNLKEKEEIMLNNENAKMLIDNYKKLQEESKFNNQSEFKKRYHLAKLAMDENYFVIAYKEAYKNYQLLLSNITDIVFEGFSKKSTIDLILNTKK